MTLRLGGDGAITGCTSLENPDLTVSGLTISGSFDAEKVLVASGTAAAPSYTFSGDTDNGLYYAGTNSIGLSTAGTNAILIDSSGRVGIGTTSPGTYGNFADDLVVYNASQPGITLATDTSGYGSIYFADGTVGNAASRGQIQYNHNDDSLLFASAGTERLRIDSAGNVGIGTSSPSTLLTLAGNNNGSTNNNTLRFVDSDTSSSGTQESGRIEFFTSDSTQPGVHSYITGSTANTSGDGSLTFGTGTAGSASERMRIDSSGNVGIGTTSPTGFSGYTSLDINNATNGAIIDLSQGDAMKGRLVATSSSLVLETASGIPIVFSPAGSEGMRIDSSGRLLVGTSSAATVGNATVARIAIQAYPGSETTGQAIFSLQSGRAPSSITAGNRMGEIGFNANNGAPFAEIVGEADGTAGTNDYPGRLVFSTTANGASSPTERMRIGNNGYTGLYGNNDAFDIRVGTSAGTSNAFLIGRYSATGVLAGGTVSLYIWSNGNIQNTNNSYTGISDIKLKENIVDANSQWADIKDLRVRNYNFIEGQTHTQIGLVAQEVELVSPGLVSESPDRDEEGTDLGTVTKSVNYSVLYMKAVKALQEAMERIENLEQRLSDAGIA